MIPNEQETVILFDEDTGNAEVYTASKRVADLLTRRGMVPYKTDTSKRQVVGWFFKIPKTAVILKPGNRSVRIGGSRINSTDLDAAIIAAGKDVIY